MKTICVYVLAMLMDIPAIAQPEVKSMAEAGKNGIFIYFGRGIVSPSNPFRQIEAYKAERKEAGKNNWITIGEYQAPSSLDEFKRRFNEALPYFPQPQQDSPVPLERIWQMVGQHNTSDSIAPYNFYLPVMIALGYAGVDKTIKSNVTYQYRVSHKTGSTWTPAFLTNIVSFPFKQEMPKPASTRTFTERNSIDITYGLPGKRLPSYFQVMRRDHFKGDFRVVQAKRFLSARNDSLFILLHDTSLVEHQAYEYFLASFNRAGNSGPNSDTVTLASYNFNEAYLPNQIRTRNQRGMHGLLIRWRMEKPELCRGLRLYRSTDQNKNFEPIADLLPTDTLYVDQNAIPMTRYYYHFRILGVLDESSVTSATVFGMYQNQQPPMPPIYPEAISDPLGIKLTWKAGDEWIKGYYVYRSIGNGELEIIAPLTPDTTYLDRSPSLSGKVIYRYALKAENTSHQISTFSDTVQARPGLPVYAQPPRELEARVINGRVHLSWLEMREHDNIISTYEVVRKDEGQTYKSLGKALEENNMIDSTVTLGNDYTYRVRAINIYGGYSDWGLEAFVSVPAPSALLFPPPGLQALKGDRVITLRWGGILQDGISGYKIYRRSAAGQPVLLTSLNNSTYEFSDTNVREGERYFYYITATAPDRESERSKPVIITY